MACGRERKRREGKGGKGRGGCWEGRKGHRSGTGGGGLHKMKEKLSGYVIVREGKGMKGRSQVGRKKN